MEILVFKTNLRYLKDIRKVNGPISNEKRISNWNVDRMDIDKILRIESQNIMPEEIISLVKSAGFHCEELMD